MPRSPHFRWSRPLQKWKSPGVGTVIPSNPERIIGTTKINAGLTGLAYTNTSEASLTTVSGNVSYGALYNGQTIRGKKFTGTVSVTAANLTFEDCFFNVTEPGSGGTVRAIDCNNSTVTNLTVRNCKLRPNGYSYRMYSIFGRNYTLEGCDVSGFVDLCSIVGSQSSNIAVNVNLYGNYFHDQFYGIDPTQGDNYTHNDGCQMHYCGKNIDIFGNTFMGTVDQTISTQAVPVFSGGIVQSGNKYYPHEPMPISWVMNSPVGSFSPKVDNFKFRDNWAGGGYIGINWPIADATNVSITGNRWMLGTYYGDPAFPGGSLPDAGDFFVLAKAGQAITMSGNTYEATGTAYNGRHNG